MMQQGPRKPALQAAHRKNFDRHVPALLAALLLAATALSTSCRERPPGAESPAYPVITAESFQPDVERFNTMVEEGVVNHIPDADAWDWMGQNIPRFDCPDPDIREIYYYRWWTYRKHIKSTPDGFVITEFIRPVGHASKHNAISCALGHHIHEGRWLHNQEYLNQYIDFWLRSGENGGFDPGFHSYSGWISDSLYNRYLVNLDREFVTGHLDDMILDFKTWEQERRLENGLFWQYDVRDGMEESVSGSRRAKNARPTINSYMFGNARAISRIARMAGREDVAAAYEQEAARIKDLVQTRLWDPDAVFFKALLETGKLADVREEIGFTPWYFELPDPGYEEVWRQLTDPQGFYAPYGPTTAEQRHPGFVIATEGDDCQWNGPSWPFSTAITLKALANLLHDYEQDVMTRDDYFDVLEIYTKSHRLQLDDGRTIPWIDENLNPFTGEWHARRMKIEEGRFDGRGDHYNHSSYNDLIITGLIGLRPREDNVVEVDPLLPPDRWDWFCLDQVPYHGRMLTILWDRNGEKYNRGKGLQILVDGKQIARSEQLDRLEGRIS